MLVLRITLVISYIYHHKLYNIPEELSVHLHRRGSPKYRRLLQYTKATLLL